jgi:hypothetical protein
MMQPTKSHDATHIEVVDSSSIHAGQPGSKHQSPAARAALAEAVARRAEQTAAATTPNEHNGRGGLDPVRYGDWEVKGLASDF